MGFIALPLMVAVVTTVMQGGFTDRYVVPALIGLALAAAYVLRPDHSKSGLIVAAGVFGAFLTHEAVFWATRGAVGPSSPPEVAGTFATLEHVRPLGLPVVVSNVVIFLPLAYYNATKAEPLEIVALIDPPAAIRFTGTDSFDLDKAALRRYSDLPVVDYGEFVGVYRRFVLLHSPGNGDWWATRLMEDGYTLSVLHKEGFTTLYLAVAAPDANTSSKGPAGIQ
jgi:hypothetical protein